MKDIVGVIALGHLGSGVASGLRKAGYETLVNNGSLERTREKLLTLNQTDKSARSLEDLVQQSGTIILCIKNNQLGEVGDQLRHLLREDQLVISCLAQATLSEVKSVLDHDNVAKVMTTLGVNDRKGVSAYQLFQGAQEQLEKVRLRQIIRDLSAHNCVLELENEAQMQVFTVAVGCFPGVMAYFLSGLEEVVAKEGGDTFANYGRMLAVLLRSTADLLDSAGSTEALVNTVATEGGVTQAIVNAMKAANLIGFIGGAIKAGLGRMRK